MFSKWFNGNTIPLSYHVFVLWLVSDFASSKVLNTSLVLSEWASMNKSTNILTNRSIAKEKLHHQYGIKMAQFIMYKNLLISSCWQGNNSQVTLFSAFCFTAVKRNWKKVLGLVLSTACWLTEAKWMVYTKGLVEEKRENKTDQLIKSSAAHFVIQIK